MHSYEKSRVILAKVNTAEAATESARDICSQLRWYTCMRVVEPVQNLGVISGIPASLHYGHALGMS